MYNECKVIMKEFDTYFLNYGLITYADKNFTQEDIGKHYK